MTENTFYVYVYFDPIRDLEPFYVGKGRGTRSHCHLSRTDNHPFTYRIQNLAQLGVLPVIERYENLSEKAAFDLEIALIKENTNTKRIMLFPTKEHYSKPSEMIYIQKGLAKIKGNYANKGIKSIAFPKLGCGLGGLDWNQVEKEIISALGEENLLVEIYI